MAENSKIEWCDHTFNPWVGCTKVSPACDNCYAEGWSKRAGRDVWGPRSDRQQTKTQGNPIKWNKALEGTARRERVFVASLADVFDNHKSILPAWRASLWSIIRACPNLDFLMLTKRPQNIQKYLPDGWGEGYENVWLGTTVENQTEANRRIPHLLKVPAKIRFLSCEPLLGPIDFSLDGLWFEDCPSDCENGYTEPDTGAFVCRVCEESQKTEDVGIDWVITGGESGPGHRVASVDWYRGLRDQCQAEHVAFLFKQWHGTTKPQVRAMGRELDGVVHDGYPVPANG